MKLLQIEDLSQQVHKAAAEKFKVPLDPSPLTPDIMPSITIKEESEEEEEVKSVDTVFITVSMFNVALTRSLLKYK